MMRYFRVLFLLIAIPLAATEFYVDPETGKPKLVLDDPTQPVEEILSSKSYSTGAKTYSVPYDDNLKNWSFPSLPKNEYLKFNQAAIEIGKGRKSALSAFPKITIKKEEFYDVKATPYFWNFLEGNIDKQKRIAQAASQVAEEHGEALIFKLLLSESKEVRQPAWSQIERLSRNALIGVWVRRDNKDMRKALAEKFVVKKENSLYQKIRDRLTKKDGWKKAFDKKTPPRLAHLYIDHLLNSEELLWDEKQKKTVNKLLKSSKANKDWKLLAQTRIGNKISIKALEKISRHKDWYLRAAACQAISYRADLAWDAVNFLLERQRDFNLYVREAANQALLKLHPLPYEFKPKHILKFDNEVIVGWETWWTQQRTMGKDIKSVAKEKLVANLKHKTNQKVYYGASSQNFDVLYGKHKKIKKTIYLIDANKDGDYEDYGVDRIALGNVESKPSVLLSRVISDGNKLYLIDIKSKEKELRLKPYKGKKKKIEFKSTFAAEHKPFGIVVSSAPDMNFLVQSKGTTTLPLADYKFTAGWILKKRSEAARITETPRSSNFTVSKDTVTPITYGSDFSMELDLEYNKSKKTLTLKPVDVVGQAGEVYRKISPKLDLIEIEVEAQGKKDSKRRDWTPFYLNVKTKMLGGLVPPFEDEQIPAYKQNYENYRSLKLIEVPALQAELLTLKSNLTIKQAQLVTEQAKEAEKQDKELITKINSEIDQLEKTDIPAKEQSLKNAEEERDRLYNYLEGGAGLAGRSFMSFTRALYRESGLKLLARAMSDIAWKDYVIDLKKIKGIKNVDELKLTLKSKIALGPIQEKTISVPLK